MTIVNSITHPFSYLFNPFTFHLASYVPLMFKCFLVLFACVLYYVLIVCQYWMEPAWLGHYWLAHYIIINFTLSI